MPATSLVLPFAVPAKEGAQAFSPNMELAAILLLAEAKRKKRRLLETTPKRTSSVSKLHYPMWAIPWENGSLIIDGLGILSSAISFQVLPRFTDFVDEVECGASVRQQFWSALEKHEKTFKDFAEIDEVPLNALVTDAELLSAILEYVKETSPLGLKTNDTIVLAPPRIDQQAAIESAKQVSSLSRQIQSEIRGLEYVRNLLGQTARFHEQMILKEIEFVREAYEHEISKFRPAVEKRVDQLLKERDARITKMNRILGNELRAKEGERERRERELQRLELSRADYLKRRETRKRRRDKIGETVWEHRIRIYENRIDEAKSRIRVLSEFIEKTRRQKDADTDKLRYGYQALIDQEKKKITDIEIQRDRNMEAKQMEIDKLKQATISIIGQIETLMERKRMQEGELKKLAIPLQFEDATLLCLPFYFICYQAGEKTQIQVFSPFKVTSSQGIVKTLQKTIRSLRPSSTLALFLQSRSRALTKMFDFVFEEKMKSDKILSESLLQSAASSNVLTRHNFKETLMKGVKELKAEEWISQSQGEALINVYAST